MEENKEEKAAKKEEKAAKREEKKQQWESFVRKSKTKTKNHTTMVRFYNAINNALILSVILLSGILTCAILLGGIGKTVLASLGASCAVLSATAKFLVADRKRTGHKRFAKLFQTLLIRMLRCDTLPEYTSLWHELQEAIIREPLVLIWHRKSKKTKIIYTMAPGLEEALERKVEQPTNHPPPQAVYRPPMNYRPNEFNPHDFHVMSIGNGQSSQQAHNRGDYAAISGFQENKTRTTTNNNRPKSREQLAEEKTPFMASSPTKNKMKKKKTDGEKSRQASLASQETLEEIEEERDNEEQNLLLTTERKGKQKKGLNNQAKSSQHELPPPPPPSVGDYDDDEDQELQQIQVGRATSSSSKSFRSTMQSRNDRSIVYDEEEENDLSEDTDDLDENEEISFPRN